MNINNKPIKERHKRISKDEVRVRDYGPLVHKFIRGYIRTYGAIVSDHYDEFYAVGLEGIMKAKKVYDPERGTFVTIAYRKVFTEVHKLYKQLVTDHQRKDLSTEEQIEQSGMHQRTLGDALGSAMGSSINYEALGRVLNVEDRQLYECLLQGMFINDTCKKCGISRRRYHERVAQLKETIVEHFRILNGD